MATFMMYKLSENLAQVAQEINSIKHIAESKDLAPMPKGQAPIPLPSAKAWRSWISVKLFSWCGLQGDGFCEFVQAVLADSSKRSQTFIKHHIKTI